MRSRGLIYWGLGLFGVGAAAGIAGLLGRFEITDPVRLSPLEALRQLGSERAVTVTGRLNAGRALYNIALNTDIRNRPDLLRQSSPLWGVPLLGPEGVPREQWYALVGSYVSVEARISGQALALHLTTESNRAGLATQYLFAQLDRGDLWVLSRGRAFFPFGGFEDRGRSEERAWLQAGVYKGHLHRLEGYGANGLTYPDIKRLYASSGIGRAETLEGGWLIVEASQSRPPLSGRGWHVYVPFESTGGEVWVRLPLETDLSSLPSEIRGVWLPLGRHAFAPGTPANRVALVLANPDAMEEFLRGAWLRHWSGAALLAAAILAVAAAVLLALGLTAGQNPIRRAAVPALVASALLVGLVVVFDSKPADAAGDRIGATIILTAAATFGILWLVTIWYRRKRCRDAGLLKYRQWAFAWPWVSERKRYEVAGQLNDQALFWAHFLPEHRPDAKRIVRAQLRHRGYAQQDIDRWTPAPDGMTVPYAVETPVSLARYRFLMGARRWCLYIYYLGVAIILVGIGAIVASEARPGHVDVEFRQVLAVLTILVMSLAGLIAFLLRNRALRILLLRPFGEKRMTRALRRFVCKNAGRAGNVFTLSDRNYKSSILVTVLWRLSAEGFFTLAMLVLGPLLRSSKRIASVKRERKFRKLARHLLRKSSPSFWSFVNRDQAFNIRSSDGWWQMCIHMLMHSCEIIVVDLSKVKEGTAWELEQLHAKNLLGKCVFIVGEEHMADVEPMLDRHFLGNSRPAVHVYRGNGTLADKAQFNAHFGRVIEAGLARWGR